MVAKVRTRRVEEVWEVKVKRERLQRSDWGEREGGRNFRGPLWEKQERSVRFGRGENADEVRVGRILGLGTG